jgi:non-ribosomal peptide synthetase component F
MVVDRPLSGEPRTRMGEAWEHPDPTSTAKLRDLAREEGLTLNAMMTGASAIPLHRYSSQEDVVFGAPRAC